MKQVARFSALSTVPLVISIGVIGTFLFAFVFGLFGLFGFPSNGNNARNVENALSQVPPVPPMAQVAHTSTPLPTSTILPDLEYIPLYPGAKILEASEEAVGHYKERRVVLVSSDNADEVYLFYKQQLPKNGWRLHSGYYDSAPVTYVWTDPSGASPWHLELYLSIERTGDDRGRVTMRYSRAPDVENIPLYADATEVEVHREEQPGGPELRNNPVTIVTKTFVTRASKEEIADYYNTTLLGYGWFFFDKSGAGQVLTQTGSLDGEGLYFKGWRLGSNPSTDTIVIDLYITANHEADGRLRVQLRTTTKEVTTTF